MEPKDFNRAIDAILDKQCDTPWNKSTLVGISGIDGSGKGYVTKQLADHLQMHNVNAISIGIDGWLNLPPVRFNPNNPAEHFYENALRFDQMFSELVLPLKNNRRVSIAADYTEETAIGYRRQDYQFEDVDVILLEGIYLFKPAYRDYFDLKIWIDCTFETALERALRRGQESLPPAETIQAFNAIYLPAQRIHFAKDNPQTAADLVIVNDGRLANAKHAKPNVYAAAMLF